MCTKNSALFFAVALLTAAALTPNVAAADEPDTPAAFDEAVHFSLVTAPKHCWAVAPHRATEAAYVVRSWDRLAGLEHADPNACDPSALDAISPDATPLLALAVNGCGGSDDIGLSVVDDQIRVVLLETGQWSCKRGGTVNFWYVIEGLGDGPYEVVVEKKDGF